MRKFVVLVALVLVVGFAFAQQEHPTPAKQEHPTAAAKPAAKNVHQVTTWFVSADADAKTITFKDEKGQTVTAPVLGKAVADLGNFKAGDKVVLKCKDDDKGEHLGVVGINMAKATAAKKG